MKYINLSDGIVGFVQLITLLYVFEECNDQT